MSLSQLDTHPADDVSTELGGDVLWGHGAEYDMFVLPLRGYNTTQHNTGAPHYIICAALSPAPAHVVEHINQTQLISV